MPKHGENIWRRKDGRWEARYIKSYNQDGKAQYSSVYAKTYSEVKQKRNEILTQKIDEPPKIDNQTTFDVVLNAFLNQQKFVVKESTFAHYYNIINTHILPKLGDLNIDQLNSQVIENFSLEKLTNGRIDSKGGLSPKTVKDMLSLLKNIFKYAAAKGYCQSKDISFISFKNTKKDIQVLTPIEQEKLELTIKNAKDNYTFGIYLSLYTGLRIGEICALRWTDIDFENNILYVNHTILRIKNTDDNASCKTKIIINNPKSESSQRKIPLPTFLSEQLFQRKMEVNNKNSYILTGTLNYIEPRNYYLKYKRHLKESGLGNYTFHALRHTFATRCIECGFDAKSLSEILGHADVKITLERYVHPSMDLKRSHMEKLCNYF